MTSVSAAPSMPTNMPSNVPITIMETIFGSHSRHSRKSASDQYTAPLMTAVSNHDDLR